MGRRKRYSFYAVRCGLQTGIFNTWEECQAVTHRVSGAKHKGFDYRSDAEAYLAEAPNVALAPKPPIEPGAGTNMTSGRHAVTAPAPSAACPPAPEPPSSPSSDAVFDDGLDDLLSGEFSDDPEMAFYVAIGQQSLTGAVPDEAPPPYSELPPLHPTTRQTTFNSVASSSFLVNPLRTTPTSTMDLLNARQASVPPSPSRSSNPNPPPAAPAAGPAAAPPAQLSPEQQNALSLAISGENLFLTGPGGAGKSFLIDRICAELSAPRPSPSGKPMPGKSVHRTATTGIAALNINGLTIHSWAGIDRGLEKPALIAGTLCATAKRRGAFRRWLEADVLIIDEISMFSDQMLRVVDEVGRHVRKRIWADAVDWPRVGLDPRFGKDFRDRVSEHDIEKPFGGLQVILSGDFYQLPPVDMSKWRPEQVAEDSQTDSQTRDTTMREDLAERPQYAFDGTSWKSLRLRIVELTKVFRQADAAFVGMLNQLRLGHCPEPTERVLRARCRLPSQEEAQKAAKLYGRNIDADTENQRQFGGLQGPEWRYKAWDGYEPDTPQEFRDMLKE